MNIGCLQKSSGLTRREVSKKLIERFDMEEGAKESMKEFEVEFPWQVLLQIRLRIHEKILADSQLVINHLLPCSLGLLKYVRLNGFLTGLATTSHSNHTNKILKILSLKDEFDFIAA